MAAFDQHDARIHILAYCTVILFSILLIFSGFYAQIQKADAIRVENDVRSDLRARDVNHLIDAIPKCVANCIFPTILDKGCAHSDYKCICENLRALDDPIPVAEDPCLVPRSDEQQNEEKDDSFRVCVKDCSLHEQLRAPAFVINLCYNMDVPFKLPEVMFQMAKRAGALSSGIPVFSSSFVQSIAPVLVPTTTSTTSTSHTSTITFAETSSSTSTGTTAKNTFPTFSIPTSTTSTGSGSVVSPTNNSSPDTSSNSGLSPSAKIAIGVAIPLVVIVLAIAAFWYFRQRHRKNRPPVMENEVHDGGLPEVTTISDIKKPGQVRYPEAKEGRIPVEAGGMPIAEMGDIRDAARRPSAFELHNQSSTPQLDSRAVDRAPPNPRASPINAPVTRKAVSPPLNPAGTSSSAFPPPWEADPSAMEFHVPQNPLGHPPRQAAPQSPQISLPTGQVTARQSMSGMGATGSGDAEILREELELAQVRQREAELLKNIAERRRMGGPGGSA